MFSSIGRGGLNAFLGVGPEFDAFQKKHAINRGRLRIPGIGIDVVSVECCAGSVSAVRSSIVELCGYVQCWPIQPGTIKNVKRRAPIPKSQANHRSIGRGAEAMRYNWNRPWNPNVHY